MTGFNLGSLILGLFVIIWALRLGIFLFTRIQSTGEDKRFQSIKRSPSQFFMTWTLQGMWVTICSACTLTAIANGVVLNGVFLMGFLVFLLGFSIEIIADHQKSSFRKNQANQGHFIKTGLWAYSKHPNYLGEITLWVGIAICSLSSLSGLQLITLISPIFTYVLLVYISGIPLLKARGKEKWGHLSQYQEYIDRTPTLFFNPLKSFDK
jgi:steroid 5-alpha reductase family enzyme